MVGRIVEEGRACVIVVNKWDAIEKTLTIYEYEKHLKKGYILSIGRRQSLSVP